MSEGLYADEDERAVTRRSYDETAALYAANTAALPPEPQRSAFLGYLSPSSAILDLGCGPGRDARYFVDHGHRVVGVDIAPNMVQLAQRAVPEASFVVGAIESLALPAESFDAVWASAALLHVSKEALPTALALIHRVLKAEGIFYLSMKKGLGQGLQADQRYGGVAKFWNYVDEAALGALLAAQGFVMLEQATREPSAAYQTHPWITVICRKAHVEPKR